MGYRVEFSFLAERDLESIVRFLAQKYRKAALRIGEQIVDIAVSLSNLPLRGTPIKDRPGMRKLPYRHYVIFYKVDQAAHVVQIVRIWDNRRNPEACRFD